MRTEGQFGRPACLQAASVQTRDSAKATALVVEDDSHVLHLLRFILEREGYEAQVATDGRAAQALVERIDPPAVVILDVMLPYADGYQLLGEMRARPGWEKLPIIILTAKSQEKDIVHALEAGANDYLVKPFKPDELRARVKRLVKA
jgi:DNA-binding response OmpR family regulator